MKSLWFIVPAHGRVAMARVCLRQLAHTCDVLRARGLNASAVVIAADENLDTARDLGFATVERPNRPLGRKLNDGYELAAMAGVDFVVPFGTDDWIDPTLIHRGLPGDREIRCSRLSAVVSEDGRRIAPLRISYDGGDGVRTIPTSLLKPLRYRPCEEDAPRAADTSTLMAISRCTQFALSYSDVHSWQIVDWKSPVDQLNGYEPCLKYQDGPERDPWKVLAPFYPAAALEEMRDLYPVGDLRSARVLKREATAAARRDRREAATA